jgi:hypothetical protein
MQNKTAITLFLFFGVSAVAQPSSVLVGAGYAPPEAPMVAPGQVVTMYYRGIPGTRSGEAQAPLPTGLAGLSAQITQSGSLWNVPLLSARQQDTCNGSLSGPACVLTAVKLQIPYEVAANAGPELSPLADLSLYVDGERVGSTPLQPVPDNSHVLTACDVDRNAEAVGPCGRVIFHQDGTAVNADSPASKGESVRVLLYGLGKTVPGATTGAAAEPGQALPAGRVQLIVRAFVNALATAPRLGYVPVKEDTPAMLTGAGLRAGEVGVYELAVTVPKTLPPTLVCGGSIRSNYLIEVMTSQGAEPVPICVGS